MTAIKKIVDSDALTELFDLPASFRNKKIEVLLFPVDEPVDDENTQDDKGIPFLTTEQIEKWANDSDIQSLVGALKGSSLPEDISIKDIRNMRLAEKYEL